MTYAENFFVKKYFNLYLSSDLFGKDKKDLESMMIHQNSLKHGFSVTITIFELCVQVENSQLLCIKNRYQTQTCSSMVIFKRIS